MENGEGGRKTFILSATKRWERALRVLGREILAMLRTGQKGKHRAEGRAKDNRRGVRPGPSLGHTRNFCRRSAFEQDGEREGIITGRKGKVSKGKENNIDATGERRFLDRASRPHFAGDWQKTWQRRKKWEITEGEGNFHPERSRGAFCRVSGNHWLSALGISSSYDQKNHK